VAEYKKIVVINYKIFAPYFCKELGKKKGLNQANEIIIYRKKKETYNTLKTISLLYSTKSDEPSFPF